MVWHRGYMVYPLSILMFFLGKRPYLTGRGDSVSQPAIELVSNCLTEHDMNIKYFMTAN